MGKALPNGTADPAGREVSALLRTWWENSAVEGGRRPTQAALARLIGVTQATLSRYLSTAHPLMAPVDTVRALHAALGAPPEDLDKALELARGTWSDQQPTPRAATLVCNNRPLKGAVVRRVLLITAVTAGVLIASWTVGHDGAGTDHTVKPAAAPARPSASAWPLVRKGETSSLAWTVQRLLEAQGQNLRADGIFDSDTRAHVIAFQKKHGLQPDGKVGKYTWRMLVLPVTPRDTGPQVEAVQDLLHRAGEPSDITGVYTAATQQMVRDFQRRQGLSATGAVDEETWRSLISAESQ